MSNTIISKYSKKTFLILAFFVILLSFLPKIFSDGGEKNLYVHQASAFLHGHLEIDQYYHDVAVYKGKYYVPFPPFPAILLLPIVAILGVSFTKVMLVSIVMSVLNLIILMRILKKLEVDQIYVLWILGAFFLGTAYWSAILQSSSVWFFAHIVAVTFIFLAINEVLGKGRGILAGLFLGMAFLSRQLSIYSIFFLLAALFDKSSSSTKKWRYGNVLSFTISVGFCISLYLLFNWLRFDNIFNTGYSYISLPDFLSARVVKYGLFNIKYVPFNFLYMFLQGFHVEFSPPLYLNGIIMDQFGTSITFASPFVFIAFLAKWKNQLLWAIWISIICSLIHMLFYYNNGYVQVNAQRFSLDFLPLVILLVSIGIKRVPKNLGKVAIIYSICLNVIALFYVFLGKIGL